MSNEPDKIIYSMIRVSKRHGQKEVLKDISLSYFYGAKIGVLGLNGAGKSSLLKILAGVDEAFDGKTVLAPGYTIGYLEQEPLAGETRTVREVVEEGVSELMAIAKEFEEINARFAEPMEPEEMDALIERQAQVQELMDHKGVWDLDARLEMAMDALRCPPADMTVDKISGGERRRVALCRLLLQAPDILLLDEPTNHLDAESVAWLERYLSTFPGTVIAVTHDRYFLDNVAGWILELDRGRGIPWKGNYSSWLEQKQKRLANEEKAEADRQKTLARELEWIRMSPKGRHAKGKARINAYEAMLSHESEKRAPDLEIYIPPGPRLGKSVIELTGVSKSMGDRVLMEDVNAIIPAGAIVGIIGPNGGGKTTLIKCILGLLKPAAGEILYSDKRFVASDKQRGTAQRPALTTNRSVLKMGYLPQYNSIDRKFPITVEEVILSGLSSQKSLISRFTATHREKARQVIARMGLEGLEKRAIGALSGGQLQRALLGRAIISDPALVVLDEPSTYIDKRFEARLYELLAEINHDCAIILVSHDIGTVLQQVKSIACVNETLDYHPDTGVSEEWLERNFNCPIELLGHGALPHRILAEHKHGDGCGCCNSKH